MLLTSLFQIPAEIKPRPQLVEIAVTSAHEDLDEQPVPLADPDGRMELDKEQQEYLQENWTVTASQQPEALLRSVCKTWRSIDDH